MIKNFRNKLIAAFVVSLSMFAFSTVHAQATTFQKSYVTPNYVQYINNDAVQLPDNSFVIAGAGVYLTKTDARGDIVWSEKFYEATTYYDESYTGALQSTFDGGLIIGASTIYVNSGLGINHYYMYLVKTDASGNPVWSYLYGDSNEGGCSGSTGSFVSSLKQTSDSGYIVMGFTNDFGFGCTNGMYVLKIDKNGAQQWSETFDISGTIRTDGDIIQADNGDYLVVGAGTMLRLSSAGNLIWAETLTYGSAGGIKPTAGGYYVGFGSTLIKTDTSGNVIWANNYNTSVASIAATSDSGCVVTGTSYSYNGAMMVKINSNGSVAFANSYGASGIGGNTVLQTLDQGYAVLGYTSTSNSDLYFIKTDPLGNSGCSQTTANITATKVTVTPTTLTPDAVMRTSEVFSDSSVLTHVNTTIDSICASVSTSLSASIRKTDVTCNGLCNGMATAIPAGGTSPYTFLWNTGPADTMQTIPDLCAGNYAVTITDHAGDTASAGITIKQPVAITSTITASKDSFCAGDSTTLFVTGNTANLLWQSSVSGNGFTTIPGIIDSVYSTAPSQTTAFRVIAGNGVCSDTSATFTVVVHPLPVPLISTSDSLICSSDSTQICVTPPFAAYLWNTGDTSICTKAKVAGGYWVTVTDANSCSAISNHQSITVYPVPSVSIDVQGDTISSFGAVSYQWYFNNNPIPNATGPVYIVTQQGSYSVEVTDTNGCTAISNAVSITGINEIDGSNRILVYPNPFSNAIFITTAQSSAGVESIEAYDMTGRLVVSSNYHSPGNLVRLELSDLSNGSYYLKIKANGSYFYQSIMKQ